MIAVFAASSGEYSDYRVHSVFSTREAAEEYVKKVNELNNRGRDHLSVEEFPFFEGVPPEADTYSAGWSSFAMGNTPIFSRSITTQAETAYPHNWESLDYHFEPEPVTVHTSENRPGMYTFETHGYATPEEARQAVKEKVKEVLGVEIN